MEDCTARYTKRARSKWAAVLAACICLACGPPDVRPLSHSDDRRRADGGQVASRPARDADPYLVSATGIGAIRLGMTLAGASDALPEATFERTSDGDGAALVSVTIAPGHSVVLRADEDDPALAIDWSRTVRHIETFSSAFHTREGIHPGSLVSDVEQVFGTVQVIRKSEIESREYITFVKQPAGLTFRLDYTGVFAEGSRETKRFAPGARIYSIAVSLD